MKMSLIKFYFFFIIFSLALFALENQSTNHRNESKNPLNKNKEVKEEERPIKRPYRHYFRYGNLC